jgi:hypothetical protein
MDRYKATKTYRTDYQTANVGPQTELRSVRPFYIEDWLDPSRRVWIPNFEYCTGILIVSWETTFFKQCRKESNLSLPIIQDRATAMISRMPAC